MPLSLFPKSFFMKPNTLRTTYIPPGADINNMSRSAPNAEVFVYMGAGGERAPRDVVHVRVDPSVTSIPARAFCRRNKLTEVELCEGSWKLGSMHSCGATIQLQKSSSPPHLGGYVIMPSHALFDVPFVSTMAL
jgi:hypothetical protein